jgi:MFS superfamily sulfate permease-like transporter
MDRIKAYTMGLFPITRWSKNYSTRDFARDFVGGLQLSTILIPQAMSYSLIACLPPESGLYSVIISGIVHLVFGMSPFESLGPFAVTSLITGGALLTVAVDLNQDRHIMDILPDRIDPWIEYPIIIPLSELFTLMISITLLLIFFTNAGKVLSKFLTKELIAGFTSAAAISIMISQLKQLFGIAIPTVKGSFVNFKTLYYLSTRFEEINLISLFMGLFTILIILLCEFIERNLTASTFHWMTQTSNEDKTLLLRTGSLPSMLISIIIPTVIS